MGIDALIESHRGAILEIAAKHGASRVRLFGSRSRGAGGAERDVDLLVTLGLGCSLLDLVAIKQDIEDLLRRRVDVVSEAGLSPYLRDEVLREATAL
jgi:hypothetical protein